jgi:hypothetical protein
MDDGMFLPHVLREPSALTKDATLNLSDADRAILLNGMERPRTHEGENAIVQNVGDCLCFSFDVPQKIETLRLQFDPDFERMTISDNKKMRVFAMKLHTGKDFVPVRVANTIVKEFTVFADGEEIVHVENNYRSLVKVPLNVTAKKICVQWIATNGAERVRLFSVDLQG